ncbi:MAG: sugar kinase [Thermomicrobiales bacterium]|nr:sugar kinase [Thermomicrobiales bacterium]MCO5219795.1 sugar kinase [Thermomicrobiales bacterium]MCO5224768.1 sugar kinase [Thermomicrobiales bacterium]MCO5228404.1 sugar kinase [Thermomicrobiales bacterium]
MHEQSVDDIIAEAIEGDYGSGRLVTFGESYVVLESGGRDRLEYANIAHISVGGPELNTAAAYASLDYEAEWVSTIADSAFGRRVLRATRAANVGTTNLVIAQGRTGLKFVDPGVEPRQQQVEVDTAYSVFARRSSGRYDWGSILEGAAALYVSGETLGVSPSVRQDGVDAMTLANRRGVIVAFGLDYRPDNWSEADARRVFSGIVRHTDVLFTNRESLARFFGIEGAYDVVMRAAIERLGVAAIAMMRQRSRGNGRVSIEGMAMGKNGVMVISPSHTVEVVDAGGAMDAFVAGFLAGYLENPAAISRAVSLGTAMAALAQTTHGEMLIATREEILDLAGDSGE